MERLTERDRNFNHTGVAKKDVFDCYLNKNGSDIITKLADYEDLEESIINEYGLNITLKEFINIWFEEAEKAFGEKISKIRILTEDDAELYDEWKRQLNEDIEHG